jgi:hypothetical protein
VMSDSAIKKWPTIERTGLTEYTLTIPVSPLS